MLPGNRVSHYSLSDYTALEHAAEANGFVLVHVEQPERENFFLVVVHRLDWATTLLATQTSYFYGSRWRRDR